MIRNHDLLQGLLVFSKYADGERGEINTTHNRIYAGPQGEDARVISHHDIDQLHKHGWDVDLEINRWYID